MSEDKRKIGIIVVGYGYWGRNFVRLAQMHSDVNLVGLVEIDNSCFDADSPFGINVCRTVEQALVDLEFDAAIVATPVSTHFEIVKTLLDNHKHVLCEKILSTRLSEIEELEKLAARNRCILLVGHTYLFNSVVKEIHLRLMNGDLGNIIHATFKRTGYGPIRRDVGVIEDLASHDLSIALFWFGMPKKAYCTTRSLGGNGIPDIAYIQLIYENGLILHIEVSWLNPIKQRLIEIVGERQMVVFDDISPVEKLKIINPGVGYVNYVKDFAQHQIQIRGGDIISPNINYGEPLKNVFQEFIFSISCGTPSIDTLLYAKKIANILNFIDYTFQKI